MSYTARLEPDYSDKDPSGRYGRYNEVLGRGAAKTVYRAFDEYEGIEVAWNQVKLNDYLQSPEDLERLYTEIHLLKTLNHKNIMKFHSSWVDPVNRNINFVTEMFSSSLRQYRLKHRRVDVRVVKHWCRQILSGLVFLHTHDPPVIHRDLKCDNILINGNEGTVKIGDLGLGVIFKRKSHTFVGTPEFIAPEVYKEEYNELVDIYSFGMCILEMVAFEYPYSECTGNAEIYKKVILGKKPDALYKVDDPQIREFVEKCLAPVTLRPSAVMLLNDPFLQIDYGELDFRLFDHSREIIDRKRNLDLHDDSNSYVYGHSNGDSKMAQYEGGTHQFEIKSNGIENLDTSIKGKRRDDGTIILSLRVADRKGRIRKICFPFDVEIDTISNVATEMVAELDGSTDQDVTKITDMIDAEISTLVPEWGGSAKYSQRHLQRLIIEYPNNDQYDDAEPKPSQWSGMDLRKPQDSVTENPIGCRPSVQSALAGDLVSRQASSFLGCKPTVNLGVPPNASTAALQPDSARERVYQHPSFDSENKPTSHLKVPPNATTTKSQGVAPRASSYVFAGHIRKTYFPFNVETDTALSVATEMVAEPDIYNQDLNKVADMSYE